VGDPELTEVRVDLQARDGAWHITLERDGEPVEVGSLRELIRFLEAIAAHEPRPVRGLR
jgi:hypothetical protein